MSEFLGALQALSQDMQCKSRVHSKETKQASISCLLLVACCVSGTTVGRQEGGHIVTWKEKDCLRSADELMLGVNPSGLPSLSLFSYFKCEFSWSHIHIGVYLFIYWKDNYACKVLGTFQTHGMNLMEDSRRSHRCPGSPQIWNFTGTCCVPKVYLIVVASLSRLPCIH